MPSRRLQRWQTYSSPLAQVSAAASDVRRLLFPPLQQGQLTRLKIQPTTMQVLHWQRCIGHNCSWLVGACSNLMRKLVFPKEKLKAMRFGAASVINGVFGSTVARPRADVSTVHPDNSVLLHRAPKLRPKFMTAFRTLLQPSPHPEGSHICKTGSLQVLHHFILLF